MSEVPERIGAEAFDGDRLRRPGVVVVGFLADWCPFCTAFAPQLARWANELGVPVLLGDLTSLESPLWERFRVDIVPTVLLFDGGREVARRDGIGGIGLRAADVVAVEAAVRERAGSRAPPRR